MRTILPRHGAGIDQTKVGLVNERGSLESVIRPFTADVMLGNPVELGMYERDQPLEGAFIAFAPFEK